MKLCRFQPLEFAAREVTRSANAVHPEPRGGIIEKNSVWEIRGELWGERARTGQSWPLEAVKLLPPSSPSKIVCVRKNYLDPSSVAGGPLPKEPSMFLKPPSGVNAPEDPIVIPEYAERVEIEGEIGIIVGRRCHLLRAAEDVHPYILGYTCFNDVAEREVQKLDGQWQRGKSFDTFSPFGPLLETEPISADTNIETFVNGVRKQAGRAAEMIFSVDVIMRFIAQIMTLEPGDLIATGTPAGIVPVVAGDVVEVSIGGVGTLRNPVIGSADSLEL
jgi:2-keto-4-pentenoate hydratase/2-oxohepta-3-ene-1,7-dioic acid hydratase in catechol pathway